MSDRKTAEWRKRLLQGLEGVSEGASEEDWIRGRCRVSRIRIGFFGAQDLSERPFAPVSSSAARATLMERSIASGQALNQGLRGIQSGLFMVRSPDPFGSCYRHVGVASAITSMSGLFKEDTVTLVIFGYRTDIVHSRPPPSSSDLFPLPRTIHNAGSRSTEGLLS